MGAAAKQAERWRLQGRRLLRTAGCVALLWAGPAPVEAQQSGRGTNDPLQTLNQWNLNYRRRGEALADDADWPVQPALELLRRRFWLVDPAENEALVLLCDLASVGGKNSETAIARGTYVANAREAAVRQTARSVLASALDASSGQGRGQWMALHVLAQPDTQPLGRRIAAAEALRGRHWETTLLPLLSAASAPERGLREAGVAALAGWKSEAVGRFLANLTLRALREPDFLSTEALIEHFSSHPLAAESPAALEVAGLLSKSTISTNWREAIRRIPFTRVLPSEIAVPQLIEGLSIWTNRGLAGGSSRRVEAALVAELELRSGKRLGFSPERWSFWWKATRASAPVTGDAAGGAPAAPAEAQTRATFFGLRPWTDRVVFVIDRSGSMAENFGTQGATRYAEALRQMGLFLEQLGPRARFDVILFSDDPKRWSGSLRSATPAGIESALSWARAQPPSGGTMLRPAIDRALELNPRSGLPDLDELEADTLIVLCDGATAEGSAWVEPLFQAVGDSTCLKVDCVQIGSGGNGTLEALSKVSGGHFVRVDS